MEPFHGLKITIGEDEFKLYGTAEIKGYFVNDFDFDIPACKCRGVGESEWTHCPKMALNHFYFGCRNQTEEAILKWIEEH